MATIKAYGHFINGSWIMDGTKINVLDKFTGDVISEIHTASRELVHLAVEQAAKTFKNHALSVAERYQILMRTADIIQENKEEFAQILVQEVGKVYKDALTEVDRGIAVLRESAEEAKRISGDGIPIPGEANQERLAFTVRTPVGVVCAITPFNFPLNLTLHKLGPAIAAGNTVVLKPAEVTPIVACKLVEAFHEAGLPAGHLNLVNGIGSETGEYLLEEEQIAMYTFTGSSSIGERIKSKTGIRKLTLELGNNSPNIIHKDVPDIQAAAEQCVKSGFSNSGQACISVQRIYVHRDIYDAFIERVVDMTNQLNVGDPKDVNTDVGPLISEKEALRVEKWIKEAVEQGAKVVIGGTRNQSFIAPTVLIDTTPNMKVMCEEVFAPVICITKYEEIETALSEANNSKMGLQVGLFTSDLRLAMRAVQKLEFGGIIINGVSTYRADTMPYGGLKNSGLGKEGPHYTMKEMTDEKLVVINY